MNLNERRKYLRVQRMRYLEADRTGRGQLLDEMEQVTQLDRKTLIRLMKHDPIRRPRQRQRGRTYGSAVQDAIRVVAESLDYICAERLTPALASTALLLAEHGELRVSDELVGKLESISVSTVKRILAHMGRDERRLPRRGPERATRVMREIPTRRIPWNVEQPGHFETDSVHHGGMSTQGDYVYTVQMIDVATAWSERVAVLGRSALVIEAGCRRILARLPFPIVELHPDNGSEFLNNHLYRFFKDSVPGLQFTRSRPWHKDDNRFVEQKNSSLVRAYLGFERLDTVAHVELMNQLYDRMWLYYNFFQPVLHIHEKRLLVTEGERPRVRRIYDAARTPFERVCATGAIPAEKRQQLEELKRRTNPRQLRLEIYSLIDAIMALPAASEQQDVALTLPALAQLSPVLQIACPNQQTAHEFIALRLPAGHQKKGQSRCTPGSIDPCPAV